MNIAYSISELISTDVLENVQNTFSKLTGMACSTVNSDGMPIFLASNTCTFCSKTRSKPIGRSRCNDCNRRAITLSYLMGEITPCQCHSGLTVFGAPIIVSGNLIGGFLGGEVLRKELDVSRLIKTAEDIGIDPIKYIEYSKSIRTVTDEEFADAIDTLNSLSSILTGIAEQKYQLLIGNAEVRRAAKMKSDFLANMSHEIRTPMNAIIGMTEMALREELQPTVKNYIGQIRSSGLALLNIINDILDFSKIESGKMDIFNDEYEPLSLINDLSNMLFTRIVNKNVEFLVDVVPELPTKLLGDMNRIKQIVVNLVNNAIKFTNNGQVRLEISFSDVSEDTINLIIKVVDTGIGIKAEDFNKIFESFRQLDSKRNRNIEGTGLGLAITKQLLDLMHGDINVESEYGKGSTFSVTIPQKTVNSSPCIKVDNPSEYICSVNISNPYLRKQLITDLNRLGIETYSLNPEQSENGFFSSTKKKYVFADYTMFTEHFKDYIQKHPDAEFIIITDIQFPPNQDYPNLRFLKKPVYILSLANLFNGISVIEDSGVEIFTDFTFTAPEAKVLIVDDNPVNLTVAEGLIKPLMMQVDTVLSGKEAIECISVQKYDIILMDHMMPDLDGIETTHIIRRFHPEYNDVPIIALTANAVQGTKEMFLKEGMNDFVPKPIELSVLVGAIRKYLSEDKIVKATGPIAMTAAEINPKEKTDIKIEGLDVTASLALLGTEELFWEVLNNYYKIIDNKASLIKTYEKNENLRDYTIEVHALCSSSKQIGALELARKAERLEAAGKAGDIQTIHDFTDELLDHYLKFVDILRPFFPEKEDVKPTKGLVNSSILLDAFAKLEDAIENLDCDKMEKTVLSLSDYEFDEYQKNRLHALIDAVDNLDTETASSIISEWKTNLN